MFRGCNTLSLDIKGRLAVPKCYRERLIVLAEGNLVLTLNPWDRSLLLYPLPEWEVTENKLAELPEYDTQGRRAKQMMRGHAADCQMDGQGRILIPHELREYASLGKQVVILGQGNKFEIWDEKGWKELREDWLTEIGKDAGEPSDALKSLSL